MLLRLIAVLRVTHAISCQLCPLCSGDGTPQDMQDSTSSDQESLGQSNEKSSDHLSEQLPKQFPEESLQQSPEQSSVQLAELSSNQSSQQLSERSPEQADEQALQQLCEQSTVQHHEKSPVQLSEQVMLQTTEPAVQLLENILKQSPDESPESLASQASAAGTSKQPHKVADSAVSPQATSQEPVQVAVQRQQNSTVEADISDDDEQQGFCGVLMPDEPCTQPKSRFNPNHQRPNM